MKRFLSYCLLLTAYCGLFACKAPQAITETIRTDSVIIKEIPRFIEIPGDTLISQSINIDSLAALLRAGVPPEVIKEITIREDPVTKNRVGILIDKLGNLTALCEIQEQNIEYMEKEITHLKSELQRTTIIQKPGFFQRIKSALDLMLYTAVLVLIAFILIRKL